MRKDTENSRERSRRLEWVGNLSRVYEDWPGEKHGHDRSSCPFRRANASDLCAKIKRTLALDPPHRLCKDTSSGGSASLEDVS
jgi:hypothetical protein